MAKEIYLNRKHSNELQIAILSNQEGNILLPAKQMMAQEKISTILSKMILKEQDPG